jgi:hypothetical protein
MSGASGARPDQRRHRRWGRLVRPAVILAVGFGSIAAYAAVSATVNAQPATPRFNGWVAVLQPAGAPSGEQVELMVLAGVPGAPGSHPELGYMVAVSGDHPFDGVLVAGGDARLRDVRVVAGPTSESPSVVDVPDLTLSQAGPVLMGPAQVLHRFFADLPPCTGRSPARRPTQSSPERRRWSPAWRWRLCGAIRACCDGQARAQASTGPWSARSPGSLPGTLASSPVAQASPASGRGLYPSTTGWRLAAWPRSPRGDALARLGGRGGEPVVSGRAQLTGA